MAYTSFIELAFSHKLFRVSVIQAPLICGSDVPHTNNILLYSDLIVGFIVLKIWHTILWSQEKIMK
jgi:hypothetical protein